MQNPKILYILLLVCVAFSACKKKDRPSAMGGSIDRTDWKLVRMSENGKDISLPKDLDITLAFLDNHISGDVACNQYGTDYVQQEARLLFDRIFSTEKYCEKGNANLEVNYLKHLNNSANYGVLGDELTIFCSDKAELGFERRKIEDAAIGVSPSNMNFEGLVRSFTVWPKMNLFHCFSILSGDKMATYPFLGKPLPIEMYGMFDPGSTEVFKQSVSVGTYFSGAMDSLYFVRLMGVSSANTVALYRINEGRLSFQLKMATANCNEKECEQQDGWLVDLNQDGLLDVVTRLQSQTLEGKVSTDQFHYYIRQRGAGFVEISNAKINRNDYAMEQLR
jgi:heat shock protein HslJ